MDKPKKKEITYTQYDYDEYVTVQRIAVDNYNQACEDWTKWIIVELTNLQGIACHKNICECCDNYCGSIKNLLNIIKEQKPNTNCPECRGQGFWWRQTCNLELNARFNKPQKIICPNCRGTGKLLLQENKEVSK